MTQAKALLAERDPLDLFDVRGYPKPDIRAEPGGRAFIRNPIAALHDMGVDQRQDPAKWRLHLSDAFPWRDEVVRRRRTDRISVLRKALESSHLLSSRQISRARREIEELEQAGREEGQPV